MKTRFWNYIRRAACLAILLVLLQIAISTQISKAENSITDTEYEDFNFIAYGDTRSSDRPDAFSPFHEGIGQALNPNPQL